MPFSVEFTGREGERGAAEGEDKPGEPGRFWRRFSELLRASEEEEEGDGEEGEGEEGEMGGGAAVAFLSPPCPPRLFSCSSFL